MSERNYDYSTETVTALMESGLSDVTLNVRRRSDGYFLDWDDYTFKSMFWTQKEGAMVELGSSGQYEREILFSNVTNTTPNDIYVTTVSSPTSRLSPQIGEIKAGDWVQMLDAPVSQAALETTAQDIKDQTDKMQFDRDGAILARMDLTLVTSLLGVNRRIKDVVHDTDGNLISATVCGYATASDATNDVNPTVTISVTGTALLGFQVGLLEVKV